MSTPLHCTALHSTPLHDSTPLHSIALHCTPLHSIPFHSTPLHSTPLPATLLPAFPFTPPLHSIPLHSTPLHILCSIPHSAPLHRVLPLLIISMSLFAFPPRSLSTFSDIDNAFWAREHGSNRSSEHTFLWRRQ